MKPSREYNLVKKRNHVDFGLQFLEIEILRAIHYFSLNETSQIVSYLMNRFPDISLSKSQFYRIIERMEKQGLIISTKIGKSKHLALLKTGEKAIKLFLDHMYLVLRDDLFSKEALIEIADLTTPSMGCLRQYKLLSIGPYPIDLSTILELCKECENPLIDDDSQLQVPIFISLPDVDDYFINQVRNIQIINTEDPFDLLPKDNSIDLLFSSLIYHRYGPDIIPELRRLVKPGKPVFMLEPTKNVPNILINVMNQFMKQSSVEKMEPWVVNDRITLPSIDDLKNELLKHFTSVRAMPEFAFTLFICIK